MAIPTMIEAAVDAIKDALGQLDALARQELTPHTAEQMTHGIHGAANAAARAAATAWLQSKDETRDVVEHGGEVYRFKAVSPLRVLGLWGSMAIPRRRYQNAADTQSFCPLDAAWGMQGEYLTGELREVVAYASAHLTPEEVHALLHKSTGVAPHPTQIKRFLASLGEGLAGEEEALQAALHAPERAPEATQALVASLDGATTLLREAGGPQGRPADRPGLGHAQAPTTAYRTAMVGSLSFYGAVPEGKKTPDRLGSRYVARMPEERFPTFKTQFEAELDAAEAQLPPEVVKVLLCDGARPTWTYAHESGRYQNYEHLVDFYHTAEHLSLAAEALFGKRSKKATRWYARHYRRLLDEDDGAQRVLRSLRYYAKRGGLSKARREALRSQQTFFGRNRHRMRYAAFRRRGLPIGSGVVEAACKTLVKARLCRSGMRWTRNGGQVILTLRAIVKSGRWEVFWAYWKHRPRAA